MASNRIKGIAVEIGGDTTGLSKALSGVDKQIRSTQSQLRDVENLLKFDPSNTELLAQKQSLLAGAVEQTKERLDTLKTAAQQAYAQLESGDISQAQFDALQREIIATEQSMRRYEQQLESAASASDSMGKEVADAAGDVENADRSIKDLSNAVKDVDGSFTIAKGAVAEFAGSALTSLANSIGNAVSAFANISESTMEFRENMAKLETTAQSTGYSTDEAESAFQQMYGVLGDETAANTTVSNFMRMSASSEDLSSLLESATGIWATYGDSIPLDGLAESVNETAKVGQITGTLADALNWAGVSEDNFNASLASCASEQERQQLIVSTLNGLYADSAKAYQENNASIIAAREASLSYQESMASIGQAMEPITTKVREGFSKIAEKVSEFISGLDFSGVESAIDAGFSFLIDSVLPAISSGLGWILENKDAIIAGLAGIAAGFLAFKVVSIIQTVTTALQGMSVAQAALNLVMSMNPIGLIVAAIAALVTAFIALWNNCDGFREFWINLWETIKSALSTAWEAIKGFFTSMAERLVSFGQTLAEFFTVTIPEKFNAIVQFFAELPGKIWEWLKETVARVLLWALEMQQSARDAIKGFFDNIINKIKELPGNVWDWLKETVLKILAWSLEIQQSATDAIKGFFDNIINKIKELPGNVWDWLKNTVSKVADFALDLGRKGTEAAKSLFDNIVNKIKELPGEMLALGSDIVEGLWNGINDMVSWITDKIKGFGESVLGGIKDFFGIESPSRVFKEEIGFNLVYGLAEGIDDKVKSAVKAVDGMGKSVMEAAKNSLSMDMSGMVTATGGAAVVNNYYTTDNSRTINQTNNSPNALSRLEIYRQTRNALKV